MRVLFLQRQPCIRAMKYAIGLRARAPGVRARDSPTRAAPSPSWYGAGDELFERLVARCPASDPREALARGASPSSAPTLIHSHNLPDVLTVLALEVADGRVPVIHDVHDMQSLRRTPYEDGFDDPEDPDALERGGRRGLRRADRRLRGDARRARRRATRSRRTTLLFANYALARDLAPSRPRPRPSRGGPPRVVYQGSLSANGSHYDLRDHFARHRRGRARDRRLPNRDAPAYRELAAGPRRACG